jgi:hypothetical protein
MSQVIVILDSNTLSVIDWYFSDSQVIPVTPGIRLPVPEGLMWDLVKGVQDGEEVTLVEDSVKVQARLDAQWASVRTQQKQKLYESDWTCSVIDSPPEILAQRDQWLQYRADLRAVTTQSDPFAIVWPTPPN